MRRNNRFLGLSGVAMVLFLFFLFPCLYAQDAIPAFPTVGAASHTR